MTASLPASNLPSVVIELYGVPRVRTGQRRCSVRARSVGEAIVALEKELPSLAGDVLVRGWPIAAYRISLNGKFFVTDPAEQLTDGDALVLVSADAGG